MADVKKDQKSPMGIMANVMASEDGIKTSSKVSDCYVRLEPLGSDGQTATPTVVEENTESNAPSVSLGLEGWLVASLAGFMAFIL